VLAVRDTVCFRGYLVGDGAIDPLTPEALVYEPMPGGQLRLVGVEYVVFKADWDKNHSSPPQLFNHTFFTIPAGNRYGLPDFYELHAWIWRPNPSGIFQNWNPNVTWRGNRDTRSPQTRGAAGRSVPARRGARFGGASAPVPRPPAPFSRGAVGACPA